MTQVPPELVGWLVTAVLVVAAVIDGRELRVPNKITFPFAIAGLAFAAVTGGFPGLGQSLLGLALGLALLLPLYAIGGMGAGDVKLYAGVGAWMGTHVTFQAFLVLAVVGAVMGLAMAAWSGQFAHHYRQFVQICREIVVIRDPVQLSEIAAARKPTMRLLPYGIPIAVGTIGYFAWSSYFFSSHILF